MSIGQLKLELTSGNTMLTTSNGNCLSSNQNVISTLLHLVQLNDGNVDSNRI